MSVQNAIFYSDRGEELHKSFDIVTAQQLYKNALHAIKPLYNHPSVNPQVQNGIKILMSRLLMFCERFQKILDAHQAAKSKEATVNFVGAHAYLLENITPYERDFVKFFSVNNEEGLGLGDMCRKEGEDCELRNDFSTAFFFYHKALEYYIPLSKTTTNANIKKLVNDQIVILLPKAENMKPYVDLSVRPPPDRFIKEEMEILRISTVINTISFNPFMDETEQMKEQWVFPQPFEDREGFEVRDPSIALGRAIKVMNVDESRLKIFGERSCASVKQTTLPDCTFLSTLAVCALHEREKGMKLLSPLIFPQLNGEAMYSRSGKYVVKLFINGTWRCVTVDDQLACSPSSTTTIRCAYSNNKGELWVSLLEKAVYKLLYKGYSNDGSFNCLDCLHLVTGWVPERWPFERKNSTTHINIQQTMNLVENLDSLDEADANTEDGFAFREKLWSKIHDGVDLKMCMACVGTKEMSEADEEKTGLASAHAYSVLSALEIDASFINGTSNNNNIQRRYVAQSFTTRRRVLRLVQLKNPWARHRWKGKYGVTDTVRWTPRLQQIVGYDPTRAAAMDDGIFYIDLDSLILNFRNIYFAWSPQLFPFWKTIHCCYEGRLIVRNPRLSTLIEPCYLFWKDEGQEIWLLLQQHIVSKDVENVSAKLLIYRHAGFDSPRVEAYYKRYFSFTAKPPSPSTSSGKEAVLVYSNNTVTLEKIKSHRAGYYSVFVDTLDRDNGRNVNFTITCYSEKPFKYIKIEPLSFTSPLLTSPLFTSPPSPSQNTASAAAAAAALASALSTVPSFSALHSNIACNNFGKNEVLSKSVQGRGTVGSVGEVKVVDGWRQSVFARKACREEMYRVTHTGYTREPISTLRSYPTDNNDYRNLDYRRETLSPSYLQNPNPSSFDPSLLFSTEYLHFILPFLFASASFFAPQYNINFIPKKTTATASGGSGSGSSGISSSSTPIEEYSQEDRSDESTVLVYSIVPPSPAYSVLAASVTTASSLPLSGGKAASSSSKGESYFACTMRNVAGEAHMRIGNPVDDSQIVSDNCIRYVFTLSSLSSSSSSSSSAPSATTIKRIVLPHLHPLGFTASPAHSAAQVAATRTATLLSPKTVANPELLYPFTIHVVPSKDYLAYIEKISDGENELCWSSSFTPSPTISSGRSFTYPFRRRVFLRSIVPCVVQCKFIFLHCPSYFSYSSSSSPSIPFRVYTTFYKNGGFSPETIKANYSSQCPDGMLSTVFRYGAKDHISVSGLFTLLESGSGCSSLPDIHPHKPKSDVSDSVKIPNSYTFPSPSTPISSLSFSKSTWPHTAQVIFSCIDVYVEPSDTILLELAMESKESNSNFNGSDVKFMSFLSSPTPIILFDKF